MPTQGGHAARTRLAALGFLLSKRGRTGAYILHVLAVKAISGNELTCLTAEWSMVFPPFAKGGKGGFEPQGLTPPVKIPPNPPLFQRGETQPGSI